MGQNDGCVLFQNPFISRTEILLILCGIHTRIIEPYVIIQIWNILHVDNYVMKSNHNIINQVLTVCNFLKSNNRGNPIMKSQVIHGVM